LRGSWLGQLLWLLLRRRRRLNGGWHRDGWATRRGLHRWLRSTPRDSYPSSRDDTHRHRACSSSDEEVASRCEWTNVFAAAV
jgi:hypothetical protein